MIHHGKSARTERTQRTTAPRARKKLRAKSSIAQKVETLEARELLATFSGNIKDSYNVPMAGVTVYVDLDNSGTLNAGDVSSTTNANGDYVLDTGFLFPTVGFHFYIAQVVPNAYKQISPDPTQGLVGDTEFGRYRYFAATSLTVSNLNFVNKIDVLQVETLTPTSTGFKATFTTPIDPTNLALYSNDQYNYVPSLTLNGPNGKVKGSLIFGPGNAGNGYFDGQGDSTVTEVTFVATGGPLAPGQYNLTMLSGGTNGFRRGDQPGDLDGDGNLTPGGDYSTSFVVGTPTVAPVVVSLPDFARGPGQSVTVPNNATTYTGIPVTLTNAAGVRSVSLTIKYDPTLLTISGGVNFGPDAVVGDLLGASGAPGVVTITYTTNRSGGLPATAIPITISASVPDGAPYKSKQVLDITNLSVTNTANQVVPSTDNDAVHVNAYLGDSSGNGTYSGMDNSLTRRLLVLLGTGFNAYPLADPVIVADTSGNGGLSGLDNSYLSQVLVNIPQNRIPAIPSLVGGLNTSGLDPILSIPKNLKALPGQAITVPVQFEQTEPTRQSLPLQSFDFSVAYDPNSFDVSNIRLGALPAGFQMTSSVDADNGVVYVSAWSTEPMIVPFGIKGDLVLMDFTPRPGTRGSLALNLQASQSMQAGNSYTSLNEGGLLLLPAPTNAANDPVDGSILVTGPRVARLILQGSSPENQPGKPALFLPRSGNSSSLPVAARQVVNQAAPTVSLSSNPIDLLFDEEPKSGDRKSRLSFF